MSEYLPQGGDFDCVPYPRCRRMRFHVLDGLRAYLRRCISSLQCEHLAVLFWLDNRRPFAITAGATAEDNARNVIVVPNCVRQPLQCHDSSAWRKDDAIGRSVE